MKTFSILQLGQRGEAVSKIKAAFTLTLFLISNIVSAQIDVSIDQIRSMDESTLIKYYNSAKSQGYSKDQLIELARLKGATPTEINLLNQKLSDLEKRKDKLDAPLNIQIENSSKAFGINQTDNLDIRYSPVYGSSFFTNPKINFSPPMNLATPSNYRLGPGDIIAIELWGASTNSIVKEISKSGTISIQGIPPVYLSGSSLSRAKSKLTQALSNIYQGLLSEDPTTKVSISVDLQTARTISVQIVGQVSVPGTFALSGFSNPIHGLYAAGGINFNGSFRNIELIRSGKTIEQIDLYNYFTFGKASNRLLQDGDVLLVPYYTDRVEVAGGVKNQGLYELKQGESLENFQKHFGGFLSSADSSGLIIERIENKNKTTLSVLKDDFEKFELKNGDLVTALESFLSTENTVFIEGAVITPGNYPFTSGLSVSKLLQKAGGLQKTAVSSFATIYREIDGIERIVESVVLNGNNKDDFSLENNDRIVVYAQDKILKEKTVTLEGAVKKPGSYKFYSGMTTDDLIADAGGLTSQANESRIFTYSLNNELKYALNETTSFSELGKSGKKLNPNDIVIVGVDSSKKSAAFVEVDGEVKNPGKYLLEQVNSSAVDLLNLAEKKNTASNNGIYILRNFTDQSQNLSLSSSYNALENTIENENIIDNSEQVNTQPEQKDTFYKIPVYLDETSNNPTLLEGDILIVEKQDNNVQVTGGVIQPTALGYKGNLNRSAKSYIQSAGGFSQKALKRRVFVENQNGKISSTRTFLFFKFYPKVSPGSKVVVPERTQDRTRASAQELIGIATSLATFGIIIDRIAQ